MLCKSTLGYCTCHCEMNRALEGQQPRYNARLGSDGSPAIREMYSSAASCSAVVPEIWADPQVQGLWKVQARLRPYRDNTLTLLEQIPTWSIQWIPRCVSAPIWGGRLLTAHCDMPAEGA